MHITEPGPIFALAIVVGFVLAVFGAVGGFLQARRERLLTHAERMKAMELGQPLPDDPEVAKLKAKYASRAESISFDGSPASESVRFARICFKNALWIGLGGFIAAVGSAPIAGGVAIAIALAAGAASVSCIFCGSFLVTQAQNAAPMSHAKVQGDPDAFDVAGRRG